MVEKTNLKNLVLIIHCLFLIKIYPTSKSNLGFLSADAALELGVCFQSAQTEKAV